MSFFTSVSISVNIREYTYAYTNGYAIDNSDACTNAYIDGHGIDNSNTYTDLATMSRTHLEFSPS